LAPRIRLDEYLAAALLGVTLGAKGFEAAEVTPMAPRKHARESFILEIVIVTTGY
jgi:hypothetical protein